MCREVLGNLLARSFGLTTPEPALVVIPDELAEAANAQVRESGRFLALKPGVASGCRKVALLANVAQGLGTELPNPEAALQVFAFDMLAQSADRSAARPNCAIDGSGYIVFDFEQCFALDGRLIEPGDPWRPCARGLAVQHVFYPGLRGRSIKREELAAGLARLTPAVLQRRIAELPPTWQAEASRVASHVECVRKHADDFVEDLAEALK
jgi:hypothetical protein